MNSLWGKFAQKWMDTQYHIRDEITAFTMDSNECYKIWDTDWFIIDFLKFKREWGSVHGYIESKTVTAT
ncbi:hypothetical protein EV175_002979 [Coemansia sp. RSA 1933]|nr:hypothetical protein EV175_002979 [Coemansia sp. RSA 1933]